MVGGGGGGSDRCVGAYGAHCDEEPFVGIAAFSGFFVAYVQERLFGWFCWGRHDGLSQSSEELIVFDDEEQHLRHATGVDD